MIDFSRGLFACFAGMPVDCFQMDSIMNSLRYSLFFVVMYFLNFLNFQGWAACVYVYVFLSHFFPPVKIASVRLARKLDVYRSFVFFQIVFGGPGNGIFADQVTNIGSFERGFVREKWLPSKNGDGH